MADSGVPLEDPNPQQRCEMFVGKHCRPCPRAAVFMVLHPQSGPRGGVERGVCSKAGHLQMAVEMAAEVGSDEPVQVRHLFGGRDA